MRFNNPFSKRPSRVVYRFKKWPVPEQKRIDSLRTDLHQRMTQVNMQQNQMDEMARLSKLNQMAAMSQMSAMGAGQNLQGGLSAVGKQVNPNTETVSAAPQGEYSMQKTK